MSTLSRRRFLSTAGAAVVGLPLLSKSEGYAQPVSDASTGTRPVRVVSSANGQEATRTAYEMITAGRDPLDAVIAGVNIVEDDPEDTSVGLGGLPNEDGVVELDAAVMHGPTHRAGAVASLQNIRNPSKVAKLVMEQTDHVLLVGEGALRFARAHGFTEEDLLTAKARGIWLYWKQTLSERDDWLTPPDSVLDADVAEFFNRPTGTIHCAGINSAGDMSCVTTTSGLSFKIPGRVGDSPIIGAGLYVDNAIGSCGSTGRGEANLQNLCSFAAVELMRNGMSPKDAGIEILRRVVAHTTEKRLLRDDGSPNFGLKFYLLAKDGRYAGVSMWGPARYSVTDEQGTRHEDCAVLYER
ncbi:MAG: twin-arginine translocation signal domain-containing protein [candidate division Zixibacteria bacterium]|nr:twin-arginine translocation signal domain-containing protein [candidate division Zixibacteria bacterium]